jgi:hypothetical protein
MKRGILTALSFFDFFLGAGHGHFSTSRLAAS